MKEMFFMDVVSFAIASDTPNDCIVPFRRDENGYLKGTAIIAAVGIQTYKTADGKKIRLLRHPDDVFKDESLATMRMLPLVLRHPAKNFTPESLKGKQLGSTGEGIFNDAYYVYAPINVTTDKAQKAIESGDAKELSVGYRAQMLMESGEWQGQPYDARQVNIRGNHLAIVKKARAGSKASFVMADGSDYEVNYTDMDAMLQDDIDTDLNFNDHKNNKPKSHKPEVVLMKYTLKNGQVVEADQAFIDSHTALLEENTNLRADAATSKATNYAAITAKDVEIKDAKDAALSTDDVAAAAKQLVDVQDTAKAAGVELKDDMDTQAVKIAVIKKLMPEAEIKDDDATVVNAFYDAAKGLLKAKPTDKSASNRAKMSGSSQVQDGKETKIETKTEVSAASIDADYHDGLYNAHLAKPEA
ncbi:MAG: DUF2213 domain-containing protein [Deltaproteobacteria bacterium]|nr:DUF2213 domain-containing protein [Deltaproteobacteria bacterium]